MLVNYTHRDAMRYNVLVDDYLIRNCKQGGQIGPEAPGWTKKRKDETETYWDKKAGALKSDHTAKTNPVK